MAVRGTWRGGCATAAILCGLVNAAEVDVLSRMRQAADEFSYVGSYVRLADDTAQSVRVIHTPELEHQYSLNGPLREWLRRGDQVLYRDSTVDYSSPQGRNAAPALDESFSSALPQRLLPLRSYYEIRPLGLGRVAGRPAARFALHSIDGMRYDYQLSADVETGLLLEARQVDGDGAAVSRMLFTDIEFPPDVNSAIPMPQPDQVWRRVRPHEPVANAPPPPLANLPAGYSYWGQVHHDGALPIRHILFTDGLNSVSVFVEAAARPDRVLSTERSYAGTNVVSQVIGRFQVTGVGDVPRPALHEIIDALASHSEVAPQEGR